MVMEATGHIPVVEHLVGQRVGREGVCQAYEKVVSVVVGVAVDAHSVRWWGGTATEIVSTVVTVSPTAGGPRGWGFGVVAEE